jgi:hypothetical protein
MNILKRLRGRPSVTTGEVGSAQAGSTDEHPLPIARYDELGEKQVNQQLSQLTQVELAAVEAYERSHRDRAVVLDKLRYMRGSEPLPGYDLLSPEEIVEELAGADARTVKAVRDYERKFRHRRQVMEEAARVLPTSRASAGEVRAREDKAALVQAGTRSRSDRPAGGSVA